MHSAGTTRPFRVALVAGVSPGKWVRAWRDRRPRSPIELLHIDETEQRSVLDDGRADVVFARLPLNRDDLHVIRLYSEQPVVVVSREHPIALFEAITLSDLEGETHRTEKDPADAIEIVAAGAGVVRLPHSIARANSRKDVAMVPISDAEPTDVAIAWLADHDDEMTEQIDYFVGIVRGRSSSSSRGGRSR
jgi:DNA-binding transcriptional LysR family regulator